MCIKALHGIILRFPRNVSMQIYIFCTKNPARKHIGMAHPCGAQVLTIHHWKGIAIPCNCTIKTAQTRHIEDYPTGAIYGNILYFCRLKTITMLLKIYPDHPNDRDVRRAAEAINAGAVIIIPTDTLYAFVCGIEQKKSAEAIARLKGFSLKQAKYSILCSSLSQLSEYVRPMDRETFALLKSTLPGPFTFIMDANNNVPRNYQNQNKTIGLRVPDNNVCRAIIDAVGTPLISTSVRLINEDREKEYLTDPELIHDLLGQRVFMVVDGGIGEDVPSTVVDCSGGGFEIVRQGKGIIEGQE